MDHRNTVAEEFERRVEGRRWRWEFVAVALAAVYLAAHLIVWWKAGLCVVAQVTQIF